MKDKLNLTINSKLIKRSKLYARKHNKSVSQLVEELLAEKIGGEHSTFTSKWLGKLTVDNIDGERSDYLKNRYQL